MDDHLVNEVGLLHERMCSVLQDPKRILILYALAERPRAVNELVELLGEPQSTVSRHLRVLRDRSFVTTERQAQSIIYSLRDPRIIGVLDTMRAMLRDFVNADASLLDRANDEG